MLREVKVTVNEIERAAKLFCFVFLFNIFFIVNVVVVVIVGDFSSFFKAFFVNNFSYSPFKEFLRIC